MKIIIINGSNRKNGATATILNELLTALEFYPDVNVQMYHVADLNLKYCTGCCNCYKTGACIFNDDLEKLSLEIASADGLILGSPTYASNISGQMKVIIDRGHFVVEQLLHNKYAISIATYENYGGKNTSKILDQLLLYSGAQISSSLKIKIPFGKNPLIDPLLLHSIKKGAGLIYTDIEKKRTHLFQKVFHFFVFYFGIKPFVHQKGEQYDGVRMHWKSNKIYEKGSKLCK